MNRPPTSIVSPIRLSTVGAYIQRAERSYAKLPIQPGDHVTPMPAIRCAPKCDPVVDTSISSVKRSRDQVTPRPASAQPCSEPPPGVATRPPSVSASLDTL